MAGEQECKSLALDAKSLELKKDLKTIPDFYHYARYFSNNPECNLCNLIVLRSILASCIA
jgi:hypothetical protein